MTESLVVNPLAAIEPLEDEPGFISSGPVPGRGMKFLRIVPSENPRLHSLFGELNDIGLAHLDIRHDLNNTETDLLRDYGILIEQENVPVRPLFSSMLDDVDVDPNSTAGCTVNPTLEFEPFDLLKFRVLMTEKRLSPYHATAWVTDARTGGKWGYWLTPEQAAVVKDLVPGSAPPDLERALAAKLSGAAILVSNTDESADTPDATRDFATSRYAVLADVIPPAQLRALQTYYARYLEQGFMKLGDEQVPLRFVQHNEPIARIVHFGLAGLMKKISGVDVQPTYSYTAVYTPGAVLDPHVDREDCEYSFSLQLDYSPGLEGGVSPWPLYISTVTDPAKVDPAKDVAVHLGNGSCVAYKGRELLHYRTPLPEGHRSTSLFFHYVPA